jgi:hypothetical protein
LNRSKDLRNFKNITEESD